MFSFVACYESPIMVRVRSLPNLQLVYEWMLPTLQPEGSKPVAKGLPPPKSVPLTPSAAPSWHGNEQLLVPCGSAAVVLSVAGCWLIQEDPRLRPSRFVWLPWGAIACVHSVHKD